MLRLYRGTPDTLARYGAAPGDADLIERAGNVAREARSSSIMQQIRGGLSTNTIHHSNTGLRKLSEALHTRRGLSLSALSDETLKDCANDLCPGDRSVKAGLRMLKKYRETLGEGTSGATGVARAGQCISLLCRQCMNPRRQCVNHPRRGSQVTTRKSFGPRLIRCRCSALLRRPVTVRGSFGRGWINGARCRPRVGATRRVFGAEWRHLRQHQASISQAHRGTKALEHRFRGRPTCPTRRLPCQI